MELLIGNAIAVVNGTLLKQPLDAQIADFNMKKLHAFRLLEGVTVILTIWIGTKGLTTSSKS